MNSKFKLFALGFVFTILFSGFWVSQSPPAAKQATLAVMKIDDVWRVVNSADSSCTVRVNKNDKVIWTVDGTNATFNFNDAIFDSTGNNYNILDGHKLQLKIKDGVQPGTYEYSVFCDADSVNAIGCSPPKIIVE